MMIKWKRTLQNCFQIVFSVIFYDKRCCSQLLHMVFWHSRERRPSWEKMAWQEVNGFLFSCQYILWTFLRSDNFTHFLILREDINLKFLRSSISQKVCRVEGFCKLGFEQIHNFFNALWSWNIYNFLFPIIFLNNSISTVL